MSSSVLMPLVDGHPALEGPQTHSPEANGLPPVSVVQARPSNSLGPNQMRKQSYYVTEEQIRKLKLLSSVLPAYPDVANLVREGIDLVIKKYLDLRWVQQAIAEQMKSKRQRRIRLLRTSPKDRHEEA